MFRERNDTKQIQIYRTKCFNVCEFCFVPSLDPDFDFCVFFADVIPAPIMMVMVDNVYCMREMCLRGRERTWDLDIVSREEAESSVSLSDPPTLINL